MGNTVTAYSPYQASPGPAPVLASPPPILVAVSDPVPQRRVTVAFRILLAVPHLFVLYWLALAAGVVAFIGWWGALFTGRLPEFAVTFLSGFLRWATRVYAYDYLLTDVYPPFTLDDDPTYPVRVMVPAPQRLNRAAVFFRYILAFPFNLLVAVVSLGAGTLLAFIAWLITLVSGQLPASFHLAYTAVLRFHTRLNGYWWMLTPAYPGGLYGDGPGAVAWADALPAAQAPGSATPAPGLGTPGQAYGTQEVGYGTPGQAYGTPADSAPEGYGAPNYGAPRDYGTPAGYSVPAGYGTPVGYGAPAGYGVRPVFQPTTWLLPLTSAAKKLMTTFIVLGSLILVAYIVIYAVIIGSAVSDTQTATTAISQLNRSYTTLTNSLNTWEQATTSCNQNLACVTSQDSKAAAAFNTFSGQLANTSVPAGAAADKARLGTAAAGSAQDFVQLSKATSAAQYKSTITSTGLQNTLNGFDQDFTALIAQLQTY